MAQRAFDPHRPPQQELIDDCVHCGFCLPTCPSYVIWGEEMDSPRGRIVLMAKGLEPGSRMDQMAVHFDRCLGCMACVTACPSGVQYDRLIETTRPQVERNLPRPWRERAFRKLLFATFTRPARLRALVPLTRAARLLGLKKAASGSGFMDRFPRLRSIVTLTPDLPVRAALRRLPQVVAAEGGTRARVGLLQGCVQRVFFADVNDATARVLAAEGCEVYIPSRPRCCGALQMHTGYEEEAKERARETIEAFEGCDYVAVNAAGCGSAMKEYGYLFEGDARWERRARDFSRKVRDVSELLVELGPRAARHPVKLKLAYHDACHLAHAQKVRTQPRSLLADVPGLELVEPAEWEICCGSAGIYNITEPEAAHELGVRKARNLLATGAEAIAAGNPGCSIQISTHLAQLGHPLPVYHPMEILQRSIQGGG